MWPNYRNNAANIVGIHKLFTNRNDKVALVSKALADREGSISSNP